MSINLLWTGGWDSTFRLVWLTLVEKQPVRPHYLLDVWDRPSTALELRAISSITDALRNRAATVAPVKVTCAFDVPRIPEIRDQYEHLLSAYDFGSQYPQLVELCRFKKLEHIEIGVHKDDKFFRIKTDVDSGKIDPNFLLAAKTLTEPFRFPLSETTKREMKALAEANGFVEIMDMTWFCHSPTIRKEPCGRCSPCRYTIAEGMGHRVPSGVLAKTRRLASSVKASIETFIR